MIIDALTYSLLLAGAADIDIIEELDEVVLTEDEEG
jgi:hypothetical protein